MNKAKCCCKWSCRGVGLGTEKARLCSCRKLGLTHLVRSLALLALVALVSRRLARAARDLRGNLEENLAICRIIAHAGVGHGRALVRDLALSEQVHDNSTRAVGAGMLGEVIAAGELLAALVAGERLVLGVERTVVALEVLLTAEPAVAELADEGLGRILGERLLASTTVGGSGVRVVASLGFARLVAVRSSTILGSRIGILLVVVVIMVVGAAGVGLGTSGRRSHHVVGHLDTLLSARLLEGTDGGGRAGKRRELERVVLVEAELLVADEATVSERYDGRTGASPGTTNVSSAKVDEAVDVILFRLKVREVLERGKVVGDLGVEAQSRLGTGNGWTRLSSSTRPVKTVASGVRVRLAAPVPTVRLRGSQKSISCSEETERA